MAWYTALGMHHAFRILVDAVHDRSTNPQSSIPTTTLTPGIPPIIVAINFR